MSSVTTPTPLPVERPRFRPNPYMDDPVARITTTEPAPFGHGLPEGTSDVYFGNRDGSDFEISAYRTLDAALRAAEGLTHSPHNPRHQYATAIMQAADGEFLLAPLQTSHNEMALDLMSYSAPITITALVDDMVGVVSGDRWFDLQG